MIEAVRPHFSLNQRPEAGGPTLREHLEYAAEQGDTRAMEVLEIDGVPLELVHVYELFTELSDLRTYHASGPNAITIAEIDAFERRTGRKLSVWEYEAIRGMDIALRRELADPTDIQEFLNDEQ